MQMRFETASRHYCIRLSKDMFNTWVIQIAHGGKFSNKGRVITRPVPTEKAGIEAIAALSVRRLKRHYRAV